MKILLGLGFLGGIGFTMAIFIASLAIEDAKNLNTAKLAIFSASLVSGILGYLVLNMSFEKKAHMTEDDE